MRSRVARRSTSLPQEHRRPGPLREGGEHAPPRLRAQPRVEEGLAQLGVAGEERREGAQLVAQGEGGVLALASGDVEEGPRVAPGERAERCPSRAGLPRRGARPRTRCWGWLCVSRPWCGFVGAPEEPGEPRRKRRRIPRPRFGVKDARVLVYKEPF